MSTAARASPTIVPVTASSWPVWGLLSVDVAALQLAFALGFALRWALSRWLVTSIGIEQYLGVAVGTLVLPVINYQIGLYPGYLLGSVERLRRRTLATVAVFSVLVAWDNLVARGILSRGVLLATFGFALILPPVAETVARRLLIESGRWGIPVLMIGAGASGRRLAEVFRRNREIGLSPIAFLDNYSPRWGSSVAEVPVLGPVGLATGLETGAEVAIVCLADLEPGEAHAILQELRYPRMLVVPEIPAIPSLWITACDLGGVLALEVKKNLLIRRNRTLKSLMDRALALPLFVASLPLVALAAAWIKLTSRGPAFYRQMRRGRDGRMIEVWKLRTMYWESPHLLEDWFREHPEDRERWQTHFKLRHDPRVIPGIGRLLRRTSLDELPQLWNVLRGDMSLVGPRPLPDYHYTQFSAEFRKLRSQVLPGLTGLWQVSARSDTDLEAQEALDTFYIRNWSLWLDVYVLSRTVTAVLKARGAY